MENAVQPSESLRSIVSSEVLLPVSALAVGTLAWSGVWWTIAAAVFFPVLIQRCETRRIAFFAALFYHMGASRSLALAAAQYFGSSESFGCLIWVSGNMLTAGCYALHWRPDPIQRFWTTPIAMILTALPPFGVLGWANPFTAAGVLFPGSGMAGFFYLIGLYAALVSRRMGFIKVFIALSLWCCFTAKTPSGMNLKGVNTLDGKTEDAGVLDHARQKKAIRIANNSKESTILFPEGLVSGGWNSVSESLWKRSLSKGKTALFGADIHNNDGQAKSNALVVIQRDSIAVYRQRQPMPLSMWKPFSPGGYSADWFSNPTMEIRGQKVAPLICHEGFLVWPVVHSYLAGARHIVAPANFWWAKDGDIPSIHAAVIKAWSRLFSIPATTAVNT